MSQSTRWHQEGIVHGGRDRERDGGRRNNKILCENVLM